MGDGDDEFSLSPEDWRTVVDLMEESQEDHEKSLEESQEKSQGAVEEREIPCYTIPSTRLAEPTEEPAEKIAEGSQNGPIALVEIRQETDETFQQGLLENGFVLSFANFSEDFSTE